MSPDNKNKTIVIANKNVITLIKNKATLLSSILFIFSQHRESLLSILEECKIKLNDFKAYLDDDNFNLKCDKAIQKIHEYKKYDIIKYIQIIKMIMKKMNIITIGIEKNYIDRQYRDSYYMHYAEKHLEVSRYCIRLIFFKGDQCNNISKLIESDLQQELIGSMVI